MSERFANSDEQKELKQKIRTSVDLVKTMQEICDVWIVMDVLQRDRFPLADLIVEEDGFTGLFYRSGQRRYKTVDNFLKRVRLIKLKDVMTEPMSVIEKDENMKRLMIVIGLTLLLNGCGESDINKVQSQNFLLPDDCVKVIGFTNNRYCMNLTYLNKEKKIICVEYSINEKFESKRILDGTFTENLEPEK